MLVPQWLLLNNSLIASSSIVERTIVSQFCWGCLIRVSRVNSVIVIDCFYYFCGFDIVRVAPRSYAEIVHICIDHKLNSWNLPRRLLPTAIIILLKSCLVCILLRIVPLLEHIRLLPFFWFWFHTTTMWGSWSMFLLITSRLWEFF